MAVQYLGSNGPDGMCFGTSTGELIAFYGSTPVDQPASTAQSAVATTALTTITDIVTTASVTGAFNSVVSRVTALITLVNAIRTDLIEVGIIKGSA